MHKVTIDPVSRIEGHLKIEAEIDNNLVKDATCSGVLFRGFEVILKDRFPVDAIYITQRICGVCPVSHSIASAKCLEDAFGIKPAKNGRILRNFMQAANYLQSHIVHFYHLSILDYIKAPSVSPFIPRYEGKEFYRLDDKTNDRIFQDYLTALNIRRNIHELITIWGGKMPHLASVVPGGISENVTLEKIMDSRYRLKEISDFMENTYLPDVYHIADIYKDYFKIGRGPGNFLSYGVFDLDDEYTKKLLPPGIYANKKDMQFDKELITEDISHSWYNQETNLRPKKGQTNSAAGKNEGYTFVKAPRYDGGVFEVGPAARLWLADIELTQKGKDFLNKSGLPGSRFRDFGDSVFSVMGRHIARAEESRILIKAMTAWLDELEAGKPAAEPYNIPREAEGAGLTEAARGALGHWIRIENGKIADYQCVVPTTWNASPKDKAGIPGAIEQALIGTFVSDHKNPIELARVVRSFDPCIACAVHILDGKAEKIKSFRVV